MFNMIGGDGREYGPVTADQLREWILDHRANGQTMVRAEGTQDWTPLANLPEFAEALAESARIHGISTPPAIGDLAAQPITGAATLAVEAPGELRVLDCLGRAWQLLQRHFLLIAGACGLAWGSQAIPRLLPGATGCLGVLASIAVAGAMFGGLSVVIARLMRSEPATLGDVFGCFDSRFVPCLLVYVVTGILEDLGLALCILPGIFLTTVWAFSLPLAADRGLRFSEAIQASWRVVIPRFFRVLGLLTLALLPLIVFSAYSTVRMMGHFIDVLGPPGTWDLAAVREKLPELLEESGRLGLQRELVLLLNLPFAWTALMTAYEDLFGTRRAPSA